MNKRLQITARILPDGPAFTLRGRDAWALLELIRVGEGGCTPLDTPGPRWSGYVYNLRRQGLVIETITESHGGQFAGHHARYVLHSPVQIVSRSDAMEGRAAA